jgi:NADH dehydrogenase
MATIGRNKAVVDLHAFKTQGIIAWFVWMFVHLISIVGYRNRLVVLMNWMWSYFSYDKGMRLIIGNKKDISLFKEKELV